MSEPVGEPVKPLKLSTAERVLDTSNIVLSTLVSAAKATSIPFLPGAAELALNIVNLIQNVRNNKDAFKSLADDACALVYIILSHDKMASENNCSDVMHMRSLEHARALSATLTEISQFAKGQASKNKLLRIFQSKSDAATIQMYRERLRQSLDVFGLTSTISVQNALLEIRASQERLAEMHRCTFDRSKKDEEKAASEPISDTRCKGSFIAVVDNVTDAEILDAHMTVVGGTIGNSTPSETSIMGKSRPDVVTVIQNSSRLKIHGGVFMAVGGNMARSF